VRGTRSGYIPTIMTDQIEAVEKWLIDFDEGARTLFQPYKDSAPVRALDVVSKLGDQPQIRLMAATLIIAGTFADSARLVRAGARMMIAHEAATLAKDLVKTMIDRTRPRSASGRDEKKPKRGNHTAKERTSFPSGHSAGALAAARAFSREFPEHGAKAIGAAAFIAGSQVPRSAHYPTDVAAGLAIGLAVEAVTDAAWKATRMDRRSTE
jgi:membrane-associated phospholipid phosphatase